MNRIIACLLLFALSPWALAETIRLSDAVETTASHEVFGAQMPDKSNGMSLQSLMEQQETLAGQEVRVTTRIGKVCQKKGCFFIAYEGDASARVSFVDYSFFVPTDVGGRDVTLVGVFDRNAVTQEQAQHFAEDMGDNPASATPTDFEYSIVAKSVLIPRS
ncbi:MAG: DUF4920 domain-containing protein [Alphaproteobacteria bacterium]